MAMTWATWKYLKGKDNLVWRVKIEDTGKKIRQVIHIIKDGVECHDEYYRRC